MLSKDVRDRIRLEEQYRKEVNQLYKTKKTFWETIDGPLKLIQGIAIIGGIVASFLQYRSNSAQAKEDTAREYRKKFYEEQLKTYSDVVYLTSVISTYDSTTEEFDAARKDFSKFFWGRMSLYEDKCVEAKMIEFRKLLIKYLERDTKKIVFKDPCSNKTLTEDTVTQIDLKQASLRLAHQCRLNTIKHWLPIDERERYNIK